MKSAKSIFITFFTTFFLATGLTCAAQINQSAISGDWIRKGPAGQLRLHFDQQNKAEVDFGNNKTVDVLADYILSGDTIRFTDKEGAMCPGVGVYKVYATADYLAFDLIADDCGGRIQTVMGFWTRLDYEDRLKQISSKIDQEANLEYLLSRARMFMALGKSMEAKADFDTYLVDNEPTARVLINRAGTRFPDDMEGAIVDCTKALELEPFNKNAYFLRGLALFETGRKEEACSDFMQAIELGFKVLKEAESEKCAEFWESILPTN